MGSRRGFLSTFLVAAGTLFRAGGAAAAERRPSPHPSGTPFRRVVTGLDGHGRSAILVDGPVPSRAQWRFSAQDIAEAPYLKGIEGNELWIFDGLPADPMAPGDPLLGKLPEDDQPPKGGLIARIHRFAPGLAYPMHRTDTVDLIIVISGQLSLELEAGSTILEPGDVAVQRRTRHGWRVVGKEPCVFVAVMADAVPAA